MVGPDSVVQFVLGVLQLQGLVVRAVAATLTFIVITVLPPVLTYVLFKLHVRGQEDRDAYELGLSPFVLVSGAFTLFWSPVSYLSWVMSNVTVFVPAQKIVLSVFVVSGVCLWWGVPSFGRSATEKARFFVEVVIALFSVLFFGGTLLFPSVTAATVVTVFFVGCASIFGLGFVVYSELDRKHRESV